MRKLKLLLTSCVLAVGGAISPAFADTTKLTEANGWSKVTSLTNLSDYYYVLVDNDADKMVRLRANDDAAFSNGTRMYYVDAIDDPISNPSFLWYIEPCDVTNGKYYFRNVDYSYVQIQTESSGAYVLDINDVTAGNTWSEMKLVYADGAWTIENFHFTANTEKYWGYWSSTDNRVAGNKSDTNIGKFQIYACSRAKLAERLGSGATPSAPKDLTKLLICPDFNNPKDNIGCGGWASDPQIGNGAFNNGVGESFNQSTCVISQVVKGLPSGSYTVSMQGFYRPGDKNVADKTTTNVALFVNNIEQPLDNIYNNSQTAAPTGDGVGTWLTVAIDGTNYYCPDNTTAANYAFNTLDVYKQTIDVVVTDGQLTIGMHKTGYVQYDWICFDNFTLTYKGFDNTIYASNLNALKATASQIYEEVKNLSTDYISAEVKTALSSAKDITVASETEEAYNTAIATVNTAISNAKNAVVTNFPTVINGISITLGFETGEYAPYNPYVSALATAKTVAARTNLTYDDVIAALNAYLAVTNTPNAAEVNAIKWEMLTEWDNQDSKTPQGWTGANGGSIRISANYSANIGLSSLSPTMVLNLTANTAYGETAGYEMPLKANTHYMLTFKYGGWGTTSGTPTIAIKKGDTTIKSETLASAAQSNGSDSWTSHAFAFKTAEAGNYVLSITLDGGRPAFGELHLVKSTLDYSALESAIAAITIPTTGLGFDATDYAPYNLIAPQATLAAANALVNEGTTTQTTIDDMKTSVQAISITTNGTELNAVYDGTLKDAEIKQGVQGDDVVLKGWTTVSGITRQTFKGTDTNNGGKACLAGANDQVGVFVREGTYKYGLINGYEMPLKAGVLYCAEAKYCSWEGTSNTNFSLTILKGETTVATQSYGANSKNVGDSDGLKRVKLYFTPETDANYVLSVGAKGNTFMTDFIIKRAVAENIDLSEEATSAPETNNYVNARLTRTLSADHWNTFCLPFDMTAEQIKDIFGEGTKITEYASEDTETRTVTMKVATAIEAGVPYLIKPASTTTNPVISGVIVKQATGLQRGTSYKFIGIIYQTQITAPADGDETWNYFLNTSNQMVKPSSTGYLKGMRAYFNIPAAASGETDVRVLISGFDDENTGISTVQSDASPQTGIVYDLSGRRVQNPQHGIYVKNGKKVVIK